MNDIEDRLRDELHEAVMALVSPSELVADVNRRLQRRTRRRGALVTAAVLVCAAAVGGLLSTTSSSAQRSIPPAHHRVSRRLSTILTPPVVHGPALIDETSGRVLRAIRTVVLPGGRDPIRGMTTGDTYYGDAAFSDGVGLSNVQRLVRVAGPSGRVVMGATHLSTPTTPAVAFGSVWVGDGHRLLGFDPLSLTLRRTINLPGDLASQVTSAGGYLWVAGWTHLDRVSPQTGQLRQVAPPASNERYGGVAASSNGLTLVADLVRLPDTPPSGGVLATLKPATGKVLAAHQIGGGAGELAGLVDGEVWLRESQGGTSAEVEQVSASSLTVRTPFVADDTLSVAVSSGEPWIRVAHLDGSRGTVGAFECASPSTGTVSGRFAVRQIIGNAIRIRPAKPVVPQFEAAGPSEIFASVSRTLVIYPSDPRCTP